MSKSGSQVISSGVDELINRLRQDGIDAGKQQAQQLLDQARAEAVAMVEAARQQAASELAQAQADIERQQRAATEAIQVAFRDLVLDMKARLANRFSADVARLVRQQVDKPELLEKLILAAAGRMVAQADLPPASEMEILLPEHAPGLDDIRRSPESARTGAIADLAFALQEDMLREGVTLSERQDGKGGIHMILRGERIEVDMSDEALANLLLGYLQPRFRAILDGIIR